MSPHNFPLAVEGNRSAQRVRDRVIFLSEMFSICFKARANRSGAGAGHGHRDLHRAYSTTYNLDDHLCTGRVSSAITRSCLERRRGCKAPCATKGPSEREITIVSNEKEINYHYDMSTC